MPGHVFSSSISKLARLAQLKVPGKSPCLSATARNAAFDLGSATVPVAPIRRPAEWLGRGSWPRTLARFRDHKCLWPETKGRGRAAGAPHDGTSTPVKKRPVVKGG